MSPSSDLFAALDLKATGDGRYEASSISEGAGSVVFGGQLLAQSLIAASRTMADKQALSMHTVFARGASVEAPLSIDVDTMHSGRAFGSATVTMSQGDRLCSRAIVLLHDPDADLIRHGDAMPDVTSPDETARRGTFEWWDVRVVDGVDVGDPEAVGPAELRVWTRFPGAPDDAAISQALLAYASDGFLIGTAMRPHKGYGQSMAHVSISTTVLAQTLAFHEPFHSDEWLLLDHRSSYAGRGRSQGAANVFTEDGRLVASYTQVNLIRDFPQGQAPPSGQRAKH
jgi:acyl-CoA thioesterase II